MRKLLTAVAAICCLFLLCACDKVQEMGTLPQISKPYAGEYVCDKLLLGGTDHTEKFDFIKLDLDPSGEFTLTYKTETGSEGGYEGKYTVSEELDEITFTAHAGLRTLSRTFPMEDGAIFVDLTFGSKLLHAEFRFP